MPLIDKVSRYKQYFLRGHGQWFALVFSLVNFTVITYYLLISNLTIIPEWFRFSSYAILFCLIYFPLAIVVGFIDFRRGTYRGEQILARELSPIWQDLFAQIAQVEKKTLEISIKLDKLLDK